jgi:hypothetical protein
MSDLDHTETSGRIRAKSVPPLTTDMSQLRWHVGLVPEGDTNPDTAPGRTLLQRAASPGEPTTPDRDHAGRRHFIQCGAGIRLLQPGDRRQDRQAPEGGGIASAVVDQHHHRWSGRLQGGPFDSRLSG